MDIRKVKKLIELLEESNIGEIEIKEGEESVRISRQGTVPAPVAYGPPVAPAPAQAPVAASPAAEVPTQDSVAPVIDNAVLSPMVGTFYRSSNPESPSFVNVGDEVSPGKIVCIVEAMKLFNEIESEVKGKIVKILVDNASPVEYDQPLFLVEPN